jgi:predicted ATPase/DNA-binding XRE family transcriptional regulator
VERHTNVVLMEDKLEGADQRTASMDTFGEWLQQQRSLRSLTRQEFAIRVGCSVSAVRKIEYGERRPSAQIAELIANCLDVPPEGRSTFVRVARGELSVDRLHPESKLSATTTISAKTDLPIFPTPLIGREREVEQLSQLLRDPQCRLLTLVGPGGIGKTRLAIETASRMQDVFANGVYFIPLAPANSNRLIVPLIADSVGFAFHSASHADPKIQLYGYLKEKQVLLLLDNLEQLLTEPGIEVFAELLAYAPRVKLLCTSRESLGLQDEWVFEVQGLPVPESTYVEETEQNTSLELFLQRARRAYVRLNVTPEDYPAIVRICQLVDGNALGIELAATWVRALTCDEIAGEIERGLDILSLSARDIPARHRSMRAVFDHSWKLLTEEEQQVLMRLSAFRGGFSREAAEQVAGTNLSLLSALIAKSLVQRRGQQRYGLHELVRQYAGAQLQADATVWAATHARHGRYFLDRLLQAEPLLKSDRQATALAQLSAEIDDSWTAWVWAIEQQQLNELTQAAFTLLYYYELRGLLREGEAVFRYTAERLPQDVVARWAMMTNQGYFARRSGRLDEAYALLAESVVQLRRCGDQQVLPFALRQYGSACLSYGRFADSEACLRESLAISEAASNLWEASITCLSLGIVAYERDDLVTARGDLGRALDLARRLGDPRLIAYDLAHLGQANLEQGDLLQARQCFAEGLDLARATGDRYDLGLALVGLGCVVRLAGQAAEAQSLLQAGQALFTEIGDLYQVGRAGCYLGELALTGGDMEAARQYFQAVVHLRAVGKILVSFPAALIGLARVNLHTNPAPALREQALGLALLLDQPERGRHCRLQAQALRAEMEAELMPQQVEAVHQQAQGQSLEAFTTVLLARGVLPD